MASEAGERVEDDRSIDTSTVLWRRIPPNQWVPDRNLGRHRPSTANFDDPELSVVIAAECIGGLRTLLRGHEDYAVVAFTAGDVRELGWGVIRVPVDDLPGHAQVMGNKARKSPRKKLVKKCEIVHEPADEAV